MNKLLSLSIKELSQCYKSKTLDPVEVAKWSIDTAKKQKDLNYFITLCAQEAEKQAEESSTRWKNDKALGNLDGVPIAIKDNFCTEDIPTTCASKMLKNFLPPYNATVYDRLKNAGTILCGKTNMDEFAMGSGAIDSIFGPTRNVWSQQSDSSDHWHIAGGSSGGSAVAVAAGVCHAALGSDTGGSVRNPASYCGVVGLKPTYGLVSRHGLIPLVNSMDVPSILTRTIDDCVEVLNAIAGPDPMDSTCSNASFQGIRLKSLDDISLKDKTIGIPKEYHCDGLSKDVLQTWIKVADILESAGARVKEISLPNTASSIFVYTILNQCEVNSNMARYDGIEYGHQTKEWSSTEQFFAQNRQEGFSAVVKNRILSGNYFLLKNNYEKYFVKALKVRRLISEDFAKVFDKDSEQCVDLILAPTTLSEAPLYQDFIRSNNRDQCAVQDFCTQPANMAGIPAISIPIRLSDNGLPISIQLMAPKWSEELLLTVSKWIEHEVSFPHFQYLERHTQ